MENDLQSQIVPPAEQASASKPNSIGITLVTGSLGAGKSTLIRRILTENHNLRIVVVENEFGDNAAVEQAIVTQGLGLDALEGFIELPNGCICCAAQDDLTDALQRLLDQKRGKFDHILIEASGLADPGPVVASFWIDEGLESDLCLDAVVAIIDSVNLNQVLSTPSTRLLLEKQLALADLVLLNKVDLLEAESEDLKFLQSHTDGVITKLRKHGCVSQIIPTVKCDFDLRKLFNIRAYDAEAAQRDVLQINATNHTDHDMFTSATINFNNVSFDAERLDRVIGRLLWEREEIGGVESMEVWRMKALVVIDGEACKRIYQSVHTLFDSTLSALKTTDDPDRQSKFIFIGKEMKRGFLQRELEKAIQISQERSQL